MHSTCNIKIQPAFITNSRYLRSAAAVRTIVFFNQLSFSGAEVGEAGGSYRHKKHTHIHKMLISFNFFLGVLHTVQKGQFIWRLYVFLCPSVHYSLPCYQRLNSRKEFSFLVFYLFIYLKDLKGKFDCLSYWYKTDLKKDSLHVALNGPFHMYRTSFTYFVEVWSGKTLPLALDSSGLQACLLVMKLRFCKDMKVCLFVNIMCFHRPN
jgi:hypothetical protein